MSRKPKVQSGFSNQPIELLGRMGWKGNPKNHDIPTLRASLTRFGFIAPVCVDERTMRVVAGHGRIAALQAMIKDGAEPPKFIEVIEGGWCVPTLCRSFDSDQEAEAYLLADNQLTMGTDWDPLALAEMLKRHTENLDGLGWVEREAQAAIDAAVATARQAQNQGDGWVEVTGDEKPTVKCPQCGFHVVLPEAPKKQRKGA